MYLLSFPRFWTLSIQRFWFLFWSILNGVTLKTSNCHDNLLCVSVFKWRRSFKPLWKKRKSTSRRILTSILSITSDHSYTKQALNCWERGTLLDRPESEIHDSVTIESNGTLAKLGNSFPGGGTWVNCCWVCATGLSEPLPHYSLFCGQL